jgi:hypothetical protein
VPEASEAQSGHGRSLDLSGTVTAVGTASVTIKTATATVYTVSTASDIDKLHDGDDPENAPTPPAAASSTAPSAIHTPLT